MTHIIVNFRTSLSELSPITRFNYYYFSIFQNAYFYQSRSLINKAKIVAAKKDIKALEELANVEVC